MTKRKVLYIGNYEEVTTTAGTHKVHYITSPDGLVAMHVISSPPLGEPEGALYYVHTDHLGSIIAMYDQAGSKTYEQNFDAWGRERNPEDWTYTANINAKPKWLIRGYTGHEHHPEFGLINMNGRVYDPLVGRMLSPDNFVQLPNATQGYNRYGYARNNPLVYTDPTGEIVWAPIIIGAIIGGYSGYQIGTAASAEGWELVGYTLGGAAIGGVSGLAGGAVASGIGQNLAFAGTGTVAGAAGGAVGGAISGGSFAALSGRDVGEGIWKGAVSGFVGGGVGTYVGGGIGAFTGGATAGGLSSALYGGDIEDIAQSALIGGAVAWGGYQLQQGIAYQKYKDAGGNFTRQQFREISVASQRSFARGREFGGWILNNGAVELWKPGQRAGITPTAKPANASGFFHSHPNLGGNWVEAHSGADIRFNNTNARTNSYVIGRQNVWLQTPGAAPSILYNNSNLLFNTYPYNYYWLSINRNR